jgi:hypothetical protein
VIEKRFEENSEIYRLKRQSFLPALLINPEISSMFNIRAYCPVTGRLQGIFPVNTG